MLQQAGRWSTPSLWLELESSTRSAGGRKNFLHIHYNVTKIEDGITFFEYNCCQIIPDGPLATNPFAINSLATRGKDDDGPFVTKLSIVKEL